MSLTLEGVRVGYGRRTVIEGLDLVIGGGQVVGLIGPNGCGKSTLIRAIAGVHPHDGSISFEGLTGAAARPMTGYMPQEIPGSIALTALESVLVAGRHATSWRRRGDVASEAFDALSDLDIGFLADRYLGECSGGQRQLISLAQTLVRRPRLIVLDEPTSALDLRHQIRVLQHVRAAVDGGSAARSDGERSVRPLALIALHDLNLAARFCDLLVLLEEGRLVASGTPAEVLTPTILATVYGISARIVHDGPHIMVTAE